MRTWQDVAAYRDGMRYNKELGDHVVNWFSSLVQHKGRWAGKPFELLQWQEQDILRPLFGWVRPNGTRRFRRAYVEVPKKNGKSTMCAGLALYLLGPDGEAGAEVYSAASDKDQASLVFKEAYEYVLSSGLSEWMTPLKSSRRILLNHGSSFYRVLPADAFRAEGLNIHGLLFDELHAQRNRELFEALVYGGAARTQPLLLSITTAGYDRSSICYEEHELARRVMAGEFENASFFPYISAADEGDDWTDPKVWAKANPSYGVTIDPDEMAEMCADAQASPAMQNAFRRYRLNQWTAQSNRWLDMAVWDACQEDIPIPDGAECWAGLDLSSTTDLSALVLVSKINDRLRVLPHYWMPHGSIAKRQRGDQVPYAAWANDGMITATPGDVIDYRMIKAKVAELNKQYTIRHLAFDRWGSQQLINDLQEILKPDVLVQFGQGYKSMTAPTRELLRLCIGKELAHDGHPVLRWNADSTVVTMDPAENVKPDKSKSKARIDGIVALIMAIAMAGAQPEQKKSIYETRGAISV